MALTLSGYSTDKSIEDEGYSMSPIVPVSKSLQNLSTYRI